MSEINFDRTGIINLHSQIGHQVGHQYHAVPPYPWHDEALRALAAEICQILTQVAGQYPTSDRQVVALRAKRQIEQQPALQQRIIGALKAGSVEVLKQACQHPVAEVAIATFEGWLNPST
jgi:hypothetical protein